MKDYAGLVGTLVGALIALLGVWLTQRRTDARETSKWRRERLDRNVDAKLQACVAYLAACRRYRRFLMYSEVKGKYIAPTAESRGGMTVHGMDEIEAAVNEAAARMMIVVGDPRITTVSEVLSRNLGELRKARIVKGAGMIPTVVVDACRDREREFASIVRKQIGLDPVLGSSGGE
ncbi:MAG TPA: hypothetical protein VF657_09130 [Actinoplanes sp.]